MKTDRRSDRSIYSFLLQACLRPFRGWLVEPSKVLPAGSNRIDVDKQVQRTMRVQERQQDGIYVYDMTPKTASTIKMRMYYFAGGGWQMPPSSQHWKLCAELANTVPGLAVSMVSPPLAPNSPASDALPQLDVFCTSVIKECKAVGERVIFAGDSSGGNIALSLAVRSVTKEERGPSPAAVLAICPAVDLQRMRCVGDIQIVSKNDPILVIKGHNDEADNWARDLDRSSPSISPVEADMSLLVHADIKVIGVTGGYDILSPDALRFRVKCEKSGVQGAWLHWEKQMHCFPLTFMYKIPEAVKAKDWIVEQLTSL